MITDKRREFPTRNLFSFSIPVRSTASDTLTWPEEIKVRYDCLGRSDDREPGTRARRSPRRCSSHGGGEGGSVRPAEGDDDSDVPSPRMWEQPASRAQLIARYRQEMMDLVRGMPESDHELSLTDIVERKEGDVEEAPAKGTTGGKQQKAVKKGTARNPSRSMSMNSGVYLLKMSLPLSLGGRRERRRRTSSSSDDKCPKVSPEPVFRNEEKGGRNWGISSSRSSSSGSSDISIGSSGRSNISSNSKGSRKMRGCYSFLYTKRSKSQRDIRAVATKRILIG